MFYVLPIWNVVSPIIFDQFPHILEVFFVQQISVAISHLYIEMIYLPLMPATTRFQRLTEYEAKQNEEGDRKISQNTP